MSEFSDVSQYLNESGQRNLVTNINVSNGVFSGTSVGDALSGNAYFFPLFPGYLGAIQVGKVGSRYPIPKDTFKCLYIAMKVDSGPANKFGPDQYRVFWFADEHLTNGSWGQSYGQPLYPEAGAGQPVHSWRLYSIDLSTAPLFDGNTTWNNMPSVEGIRIDPTINANVNFAVDWVRLTDCNPVDVTITWTGGTSADTAIWLRPVNTNRDIRVATGVDGTAGWYTLDVQGIAPGSYYVGLGTDTTCCSQMNTAQPLVIQQTPIVSFTRPSFLSGTDYASSAGNQWDFGDSSDVVDTRNFKSVSLQNGELVMVTASGPQPAGVDAQVVLNTPAPIDTSTYRYLSFRMSTQNGSAPWQNVVDGMIARLVWSIQGSSGRPGYRCNLVSQDIPYDVGYHTYTIDLHDAFSGSAEEVQGECTGYPWRWQQTLPVLELRFDPNENITCNPQSGSSFIISTCGDFVQNLDWIRLTAIDQVKRGTPYLIETIVTPLESGMAIDFFYTTDRNNPTQFLAEQYYAAPPIGSFQVFLPVVVNSLSNSDTTPESNYTYLWDTSNVPPGTYYICARYTGFQTVTYCSEAPVKVTSP